jgi:hypothetical protein
LGKLPEIRQFSSTATLEARENRHKIAPRIIAANPPRKEK